MLSINQDQIDIYYKNKKEEVSNWLTEYTLKLKRISEEEQTTLLNAAKNINFSSVGNYYNYAQSLKNINKKDKERLLKYLQQIEWLPTGITAGFLDGQLVTKMIPNTYAEQMIRAAFGSNQKKGDNTEND